MDGFQHKFGDQPLEGYTIQRAIGRGGFGEVYYAVSDSGREVALKAVQGYEDIELRGVSQCMNLKSPHLVTIFDVKRNAEGRPFVIMEYVAGPSLRELLEDAPSGMGPQKTAFFLREIAKGLTYLHDRGIVHRDLKPGNIFYEDGYVKIGDYGLSKMIATSQHSVQTITVGTVHYMAPEIGRGQYDRSIDIYALGIVLYEMLTGQVPFFGSSHGEILMKHLTAEPDLTGIEEPFATVIRRALAKDPLQRFQSVQEMVEAVFGAEHIQQSVSHFRPESLSMVARRVAEKVAVGGPGSSAEHTQGLGPARPAAQAGSSDVWQDLNHQMDDLGQQMSQWGKRFGERMSEVGSRVRRRLGREVAAPPTKAPVATPAPAGAIDSSLDPLDRRARRRLWVIATLVMGAGTGIIEATASTGRGSPLELCLFAAGVILLASIGVFRAGHMLADRMQREHGLGRYLAFGGAATLGTLAVILLWEIAPHSGSGEYDLLGSNALPLLGSLFFIDWLGRMNPVRQHRIVFDSAVTAGLLGLIVSVFTDASMIMMIGILAGLSMAVQAGSPFIPPSLRKHTGKAPGSGRHGRPPQPERGTPPAAGIAPRAQTPQAHGPRPPLPCQPSAREAPVFLRALALLAFVILLGGGILLFFAAGFVGPNDDETIAGCVSAGIGAIMFSIFALVKATQRYLVSWWSSLFKPVLMIALAETALTTAVIASSMTLNGDEEMIVAAVIVFALILFIVIACISNRTMRAILGVRDAPARQAAAPIVLPGEASPRARLWAILLALVYFAFPFLGGLHRMYVGKIGTGLLWLFSLGGFFGIGQIVDIILIAAGQFTDKEGRRLLMWSNPNELQGMPAARVQNTSPAPAPARLAVVPNELQAIPAARVESTGGFSPASVNAVATVANSPRTFEAGSFLLAALGTLVLLAGAFVGFLVAINAPEIIRAGLPDPSYREAIAHDLDYSNWPQLLYRIGAYLTVALFLAACGILLVARRGSGGAHCLRAVLSPAAIGTGLGTLRGATNQISWPTVSSLVQADQIVPAIDAILSGIREDAAMMSAVLLLISIVMLVWPARRSAAVGPALSEDTVSTQGSYQ